MPYPVSVRISKPCALDVRCGAKGRKKKEREYGSGRERIDSSVTESLHFGRLIGETAKDTAGKLEGRAGSATSRGGQAKDDVRAKLYLEKWEQEEDMSYSMFESLLNGKPLDARRKKMNELEFESILELSTDDEVFQEYEAVVLSSGDDEVEVKAGVKAKVGSRGDGVAKDVGAQTVRYENTLNQLVTNVVGYHGMG